MERLLRLASTDAIVADVMPPPDDGVPLDEAFRAFYGARLGSMFAILVGEDLIGMIRLTRDEAIPGRAETGMWLGRSFRSQGYGQSALRALCSVAASVGVREIVADTRPDHTAALAVLRACGAELREASGKVYARLLV